MSFNKQEKQAVMTAFQRNTKDTGSSEVQIALFTKRIELLTEHLKTHPKDLHSRRGLLKQVYARRSALDYLKRKNVAAYQDILQKLDLRR